MFFEINRESVGAELSLEVNMSWHFHFSESYISRTDKGYKICVQYKPFFLRFHVMSKIWDTIYPQVSKSATNNPCQMLLDTHL